MKKVIIVAIGIVIAVVSFVAGIMVNTSKYEYVDLYDYVKMQYGEDAYLESVSISRNSAVDYVVRFEDGTEKYYTYFAKFAVER